MSWEDLELVVWERDVHRIRRKLRRLKREYGLLPDPPRVVRFKRRPSWRKR